MSRSSTLAIGFEGFDEGSAFDLDWEWDLVESDCDLVVWELEFLAAPLVFASLVASIV